MGDCSLYCFILGKSINSNEMTAATITTTITWNHLVLKKNPAK